MLQDSEYLYAELLVEEPLFHGRKRGGLVPVWDRHRVISTLTLAGVLAEVNKATWMTATKLTGDTFSFILTKLLDGF